VVLPLPATISSARGNEYRRAVTDRTATHHAIRINNHASRGLFIDFRVNPDSKRLVFRNVSIMGRGD
jgi:hypothetical protein